MNDQTTSKHALGKSKALRVFLLHLAIFPVVNLILLFVPVFYDGKLDFSFKDRGPMLYGSIGWGVGLFIHRAVFLADRILNKSDK
ncbi:2TM domain-containing protein [Candidatus Dojkabacteria bacterium]|nr:2TM domain-containing protein [Candidatus Dojkabacteria bacterium]